MHLADTPTVHPEIPFLDDILFLSVSGRTGCPLATAFPGKQAVTEEILLLEMRKEFVGEGQLFYVYKRLNHDIIGNTSEDAVKANNGVFVLPIPEEEIEYGHRN